MSEVLVFGNFEHRILDPAHLDIPAILARRADCAAWFDAPSGIL